MRPQTTDWSKLNWRGVKSPFFCPSQRKHCNQRCWLYKRTKCFPTLYVCIRSLAQKRWDGKIPLIRNIFDYVSTSYKEYFTANHKNGSTCPHFSQDLVRVLLVDHHLSMFHSTIHGSPSLSKQYIFCAVHRQAQKGSVSCLQYMKPAHG